MGGEGAAWGERVPHGERGCRMVGRGARRERREAVKSAPRPEARGAGPRRLRASARLARASSIGKAPPPGSMGRLPRPALLGLAQLP